MEKSKSWLADHLDSFVVPYLGHPPQIEPLKYFTPAEMALVKAAWRAAKRLAKGHKIGLYGRDVFIWEVLARREGYPTLFRPECSRQTAHLIKGEKPMFLFDTGFAGSIPRALGIKDFTLFSADRFSWMLQGAYPKSSAEAQNRQVFPMLRGARSLALKIEATPKYWQSGVNHMGVIEQELSSKAEFEEAASLTVQVFTDSSPRNVPRAPLPKFGTRGGWWL